MISVVDVDGDKHAQAMLMGLYKFTVYTVVSGME